MYVGLYVRYTVGGAGWHVTNASLAHCPPRHYGGKLSHERLISKRFLVSLGEIVYVKGDAVSFKIIPQTIPSTRKGPHLPSSSAVLKTNTCRVWLIN